MVVVASVFMTEQGGSTTLTTPLSLFNSALSDFLFAKSFTHALCFDLEVSEMGCYWVEFSGLVLEFLGFEI